MFKYSLVPDEVFFQTIVKMSPFSERVSHDYSDRNCNEIQYSLTEHGCHYIDWTAPDYSLPKTLALTDFDSLIESNMLFARKFAEETSASLLDRLEKDVLQ